PEWLNASGDRTDTRQANTDIGTIGELKRSGRILLRVVVKEKAAGASGELHPSFLLHRASYDAYNDGTWLARNDKFTAVPRNPGDLWPIASGSPPDPAGEALLRLTVHDFSRTPHPVLSLPAGAVRLRLSGAVDVQANALGAVQAEHAPGYFSYDV